MARPIKRPDHHYKPFEFTIDIEDAFDYLDKFKNSPDYPKSFWPYTPNYYKILGEMLEYKFGVSMVEARKIVGMWFDKNREKKIVKLTESDLTRIINRVIIENKSDQFYIVAYPSHLNGKGMFIYTGGDGYSMIPTSLEFRRRMHYEMENMPKSYNTREEALRDLKKVKRMTKDRWDLEWEVERF